MGGEISKGIGGVIMNDIQSSIFLFILNMMGLQINKGFKSSLCSITLKLPSHDYMFSINKSFVMNYVSNDCFVCREAVLRLGFIKIIVNK